MSEQMTQQRWDKLNAEQRAVLRDNSGLTRQLINLEGWRVEAVTLEGETRRFIVGKSTGWKPVHLEVKTRRSYGGTQAERQYASIRQLYRVR